MFLPEKIVRDKRLFKNSIDERLKNIGSLINDRKSTDLPSQNFFNTQSNKSEENMSQQKKRNFIIFYNANYNV